MILIGLSVTVAFLFEYMIMMPIFVRVNRKISAICEADGTDCLELRHRRRLTKYSLNGRECTQRKSLVGVSNIQKNANLRCPLLCFFSFR